MMASLASAPFKLRLPAVPVAVATNPGIGTIWDQYVDERSESVWRRVEAYGSLVLASSVLVSRSSSES
jgi:hypothetical protein